MTARKMTLNRNHTHTSLLGHSIRFEKGVPTNVPPPLFGEILGIGGEFADGEGLPVAQTAENPEPIDQVQRDEVILAAVNKIAEINDNKEFNAAGAPKETAVSKRVGFEVSKKDVAKAWQRRADQIAEAREA